MCRNDTKGAEEDPVLQRGEQMEGFRNTAREAFS